MNELARQSGERAALNAFGLAHGTPAPPPSWSQEWLRLPRERVAGNITIPSMRETPLR